MWLSRVDDCALPWGQYSGVIEWCLLHRSAVYHIGLCAYVRGNLNTGCKHNSGGSSSFFLAGFCTSHHPLHFNLPGETRTSCTEVFSPHESTGKGTRASRNLLVSIKSTSKSKCGGCVCTCTHKTHRFSLEMCTSPQNVRNQGSDRDILTPEQEAVCSLFFLIWANSLHFPVID